jgi:carbon monoxide dehydrogenase subunit G
MRRGGGETGDARVDIKGEYRIGAPRERVWSALNDPEVLKACIPGCERLEQVSPTELNARVVARIGPVQSAFDTRLQLTNLNPPVSYTLVGESKGGAAGFGKGSADVVLDAEGDVTVLRYTADFQVGGKLGQVGARLVSGVTRKTADDFFSTFSSRLDSGAQKLAAVGPAAPATRSRYVEIAAVIAIVVLIAWLALR